MNIFIAYINKFIKLTESDSEYINDMLDFQSFKKNDYILREGNLSRYSYFIISGSIKKYYIDDNGDSQIIQLAVEATWTGDFESYITHSISEYNVQCLEDTVVIRFTLESVKEIVEQVPVFEIFLHKSTQYELIQAHNKVRQTAKWSAKKRFISFAQKNPKIIKRVPQYMIASYLGMSKQFLSSMQKELL